MERPPPISLRLKWFRSLEAVIIVSVIGVAICVFLFVSQSFELDIFASRANSGSPLISTLTF